MDWIDLELPVDAVKRAVFAAAIEQFHVFTLVFVRVVGLMTVGPLFGQSVVPANVRVFLALVVALLVTPALHDHWRVGFARLDANANGRLEPGEVPGHLVDRYERELTERGRDPTFGLTADEFLLEMRVPSTAFDYLRVAAGEFALGLVLGLGVFILLSALSLAGQLVDQQNGLALGEIVNPGLDTEGSISGQFLYMLGIVVFLVVEPVNGHLLVIQTLVETFQSLPAGEAFVPPEAVEFLNRLVYHSLLLALQVAAPLLATMSLVAIAMGMMGHTVPQVNVLVLGFPVRAVTSVVVLVLTLSGTARRVVDAIPPTLGELGRILAGTN